MGRTQGGVGERGSIGLSGVGGRDGMSLSGAWIRIDARGRWRAVGGRIAACVCVCRGGLLSAYEASVGFASWDVGHLASRRHGRMHTPGEYYNVKGNCTGQASGIHLEQSCPANMVVCASTRKYWQHNDFSYD